MKKLVIIFVLLTGKLLGQTQPAQPLPFRAVAGSVKNREGEKVTGCKVKLLIGDDTMLTTTDTAGRFSFDHVKSAKFFISITSPGYSRLFYLYVGDNKSKQIMLNVNTLNPLTPINKVSWQPNWKVGDKIDAGAPDEMFHQALVLALNGEKEQVKVHYLDVSYPDNWVEKRVTRPYNLQFKADSAAAASGLRPGKYVMYTYHRDVGYYQGYFMIHADGTYEVFLENNKTGNRPWHLRENGKGEYQFDKTLGIVKWLTGPFSNLDGTAHLSVSIDRQAYVIQSLSADGPSGTYYSNR